MILEIFLVNHGTTSKATMTNNRIRGSVNRFAARSVSSVKLLFRGWTIFLPKMDFSAIVFPIRSVSVGFAACPYPFVDTILRTRR